LTIRRPRVDLAMWAELARVKRIAREDLVQQLLHASQLQFTQSGAVKGLSRYIKVGSCTCRRHGVRLYLPGIRHASSRAMNSLKAKLAAFQRSRFGLFVKSSGRPGADLAGRAGRPAPPGQRTGAQGEPERRPSLG